MVTDRRVLAVHPQHAPTTWPVLILILQPKLHPCVLGRSVLPPCIAISSNNRDNAQLYGTIPPPPSHALQSFVRRSLGQNKNVDPRLREPPSPQKVNHPRSTLFQRHPNKIDLAYVVDHDLENAPTPLVRIFSNILSSAISAP